MKSPEVVAANVSRCVLCGRNPIVMVGMVIPVDDETYAAVVRLRDRPVLDGHMPTLGYGLCKKHARHIERSSARVRAKLLAAAAEITIQ